VSAAQECNCNYLPPHNSDTMCILKNYNAPSNKKAESVFLPCFVFFFPLHYTKYDGLQTGKKKRGWVGQKTVASHGKKKKTG